MDTVDTKILELIQKNGKISHGEIAREVGLAISSVNDRLKKLSASGVISRYTAIIDPKAVDLDLCAFVQVLIDIPENAGLFERAMEEIPDVQECHFVTGEYSYLLKMRARTTEELQKTIQNKVQTVPGVVRTHTLVALSSSKETSALPLPEPER